MGLHRAGPPASRHQHVLPHLHLHCGQRHHHQDILILANYHQSSSIINTTIIKVVTKLRATGERGEPADHQNWKAAKALLVRHHHDDADYQNGVNDVPINVLYYDHDNNHDTNPR